MIPTRMPSKMNQIRDNNELQRYRSIIQYAPMNNLQGNDLSHSHGDECEDSMDDDMGYIKSNEDESHMET